MDNCPVCRGPRSEKLTEIWIRYRGAWALMLNVPAIVCEQCGDRVFPQESAEHMERLLQGTSAQFGYFPIFDLAAKPQVLTNGTTAGDWVFLTVSNAL